MREDKNKKPLLFLFCKILGFAFAVVAVVGVVFIFTGFGDFESNKFMIGGFLFAFGMFFAIVLLLIGFRPEISKLSTESKKYIQQQNKDNLSSIASTGADISSEAITKTTKAIKKGLKDTKFCKYCGDEIDADSKFCNSCGKEQ